MPRPILQHAFISVRVQPLAATGRLRLPRSKSTKKKKPVAFTTRSLLELLNRVRGTMNPLEAGRAKDVGTADHTIVLKNRNRIDPVLFTPRGGFITLF